MGQLAYWTIGFVTSEEKGQTLSITYFSLHKMFKVNDLAPLDGELPGSMPRRHSKVSVIVGENTDVQGGFHLEFLSTNRIINHMTFYKFKGSHWWKIYLRKKSFTRFALQSEFCNFNQ